MKLSFFYFNPVAENWRPIERSQFVGTCQAIFHRADNDAGPSLVGFAVLMVAGDSRPDTQAKLSQYDRDHVGNILGDPAADWYSAHVLRLIKRADGFQREILRMVYPDHVQAVEQWERTGT